MLRKSVHAVLAWCLVAAFVLLFAASAHAQSTPPSIPPPPMPSSIDAHGVDLLSGEVIAGSADLSIGPSGPHGLQLARQWTGTGWRIADLPTLSGSTSNPIVSFGGRSIPFVLLSGTYVNTFQDGSSLSSDLTLFTASDGTQTTFTASYTRSYLKYESNLGRPVTTTFPDGTVWTYHYEDLSFTVSTDPPDPPTYPPECYTGTPPPECNTITLQYEEALEAWEATQGTFYFSRLKSITNSEGFQIKLAYASDTLSSWADEDGWLALAGATAINNAVEYCDPVATCSLSNPWPTVAYSGDASKTDPDGLVTSYSYDGSGNLAGIRAPGDSSDTIAYDHSVANQLSVTTGGGTWVYQFNPTGITGTVVTPPATDPITYNVNTMGLIGSVVQGSGSTMRTTSYGYCDGSTCPSGLVQSVTMPEGNEVTYGYDARGNLTTTTNISKTPGTPANIVTSTAYPSSCTNVMTCNEPTSTTDAGGNVTNYTYDSTTGLVTKVEAPAATSGGARPTVNYVYASKQSRYLTAASTWSNSSVTVLTETNTCRTAATCNGTANEARTILAYPASTTANNLQPSSVQQASGDGALSSTTTLAYDNEGRVSTVDGPLSGTNDETAVFYDADGMVTGQIGADPDGSGGNPRPAVRYTYNSKGQLTTTESGTVTALTQAAVTGMTASFKQVATYDANRRLATQAQVAASGTTQYSIVQYNYDALGRASCTALRMNAPLTTTTLPSSACTAMTVGSYGPDRIGKTLYTEFGQVSEVDSGVGTSSPNLAQATATYTYTRNGQVQTVADANGNTTTYTYDGFDRPLKTEYPDKTTGSTNTSDYEQLTYGTTSGNELGRVTGWRSRLGENFTFSHDLLGRTTVATVPDRSGLDTSFTRDVYYGYDVASDLTSARFDSTSGAGITYAYDAFGRPTGTTDSMFATAKTIGYAYDVVGNRVTVTHPDSTAFTYVYDSAGRLTGIKLGATQLATFTFNTLGQLASQSRYSSAPGMSYTYDAAGRLSILAITGAGSNNVSWGSSSSPILYNPAGEEISNTRDNDLYAFTGNANVNRNYTPNHLNQYGTVGADTITHDANGNLANDSHTTFTYDPQNMLVGASGGNTATLHYDPLGRLFSVAGASSTTQFLYDGDQLIGEYDGSGTLLDRYVFGGGGDDPILAYDGTGTANTALRQLYADRLGSVVLTTGYTGTLTGRGAYDDWGIPDAGNAGVGAGGQGRFQYTGQAWLPELGMFHYKARMYSPVLGRFMQTDPIGYGDGMNWYAYVGNNPVNGVDPTGMGCIFDGAGPNDINVCGNKVVIRTIHNGGGDDGNGTDGVNGNSAPPPGSIRPPSLAELCSHPATYIPSATPQQFKQLADKCSAEPQNVPSHRYHIFRRITRPNTGCSLSQVIGALNRNFIPGNYGTHVNGQSYDVRLIFGQYDLGTVTFRSNASGTVISNVTNDDHQLRYGSVTATVGGDQVSGYSIDLVGEGTNTSSMIAFFNDLFGPLQFNIQTDAVAMELMGQCHD